MRKAGEAQAHGKLILFGEFSVLRGGKAIGITLPCTAGILRHKTEGSISIDDALLRTLCSDAELDLAREPLYCDMTVPQTGGFGSSAALSVALARYVYDEREVWAHAQRLEHYYHGQSSGVDTGLAMASVASVSMFHPREGEELPSVFEVEDIVPLSIVVGGVPRKISTKDAIADIDWEDAYRRTLIDRLSVISDSACTLLSGSTEEWDPHLLGELALEAHHALSELRTADFRVDEIIQQGLNAGACGGKSSGAGGAFYFVCPDRQTASQVQDAVRYMLKEYEGVGPWLMNVGE